MKLGDKNYTLVDLKNKLHDLEEKVKINKINEVHVFEGGRKICLGGHGSTDNEKVEYNEILNAVLKEVQKEFALNKKKQEENPGDSRYDLQLMDHESVEDILQSLQVLKNVGHEEESPSINQRMYNLFRRFLPNFSRESNLDSIQEMLDASAAAKKERMDKFAKAEADALEKVKAADAPYREAQRLARDFVNNDDLTKEQVVEGLKNFLTTPYDIKKEPEELINKWIFHLDNEFIAYALKSQADESMTKIDELMLKKLNILMEVVKELPQEAYRKSFQGMLEDPGDLNIVQSAIVCHTLSARDDQPVDKILKCVQQRANTYPFFYGPFLVKNFLSGEKCIKLVEKINVEKINIEKACEESASKQRAHRAALSAAKVAKNQDPSPKVTETFENPLNISPDFKVPLLPLIYSLYEKLGEKGKEYFGENFKIKPVVIDDGKENEERKLNVSTDNGEHWQAHSIG